MQPAAFRVQELNPAKMAMLYRTQFQMSKVSPGETVMCITDLATRREYVQAAFAAAEDLGADIYEMCVNSIPSWTKVGVATVGQCKGTLEAAKAADLIVIFHVPLFTKWLKEVMNGGTRVLMIIDDITEFSREQLKSEARLKQLVTTLATVVDKRDPSSDSRSSDVGDVARSIAEELGCERKDVDTAAFAGNLKNLGSLYIPPELMGRPLGELEDTARKSLTTSYITSANLLQGIDFEGPVVETIRQSQERVDGAGPQKLQGEGILLTSRIVAVAAAFVELTSPRDGSNGMSLEEASAQLLRDSGTMYDRRVVSALLNHLENHGGAIKWAHFLHRQ